MKPTLREIAHRSLSLSESAFLKHYKRGRFKADRGVALTGSELPGPGFNFAACLRPCPPLAEVEKMGREFFADAETGWGILVEGGAGHPMEAELIAAGWKVDEDEPAFVRPELSAISSTASNRIRQLTTEADRQTFQNVCQIAFNAPPELGELLAPNVGFLNDPHMGWFALDRDGETISVGGYYRAGKTAVICCIATLPDFRGQGLGAAIVNHGLAHAAEKGCVNASLRSGPKSVPLYERLGFQYVCQHRTYAAPAVS
jgi:GNAT superfamily N-acetyltransferase